MVVISEVSDDSRRLTCKYAKEADKKSVSREDGYNEAMKILQSRYGHKQNFSSL